MVLSCKMFLRIQMLSLSHLLSEMNTFRCPQLDVLLNTSDTQRHSFSFSFTLFIFLSVYKVPQVCRLLCEALDTMVKQIQFHFSTSNTNIFVQFHFSFALFLLFFFFNEKAIQEGHNFDHRTLEFILCDHDHQWLLTAVFQSSLVPI